MRKWHRGPPPHVGWWNASLLQDPICWRWWNGGAWSIDVETTFSTEMLEYYASHVTTQTHLVEWTDYWPENARVPRVDPNA
jgi:hypothetical protein